MCDLVVLSLCKGRLTSSAAAAAADDDDDDDDVCVCACVCPRSKRPLVLSCIRPSHVNVSQVYLVYCRTEPLDVLLRPSRSTQAWMLVARLKFAMSP